MVIARGSGTSARLEAGVIARIRAEAGTRSRGRLTSGARARVGHGSDPSMDFGLDWILGHTVTLSRARTGAGTSVARRIE